MNKRWFTSGYAGAFACVAALICGHPCPRVDR